MTYNIFFSDCTNRKYQSLETLVENHIADDDALNVYTYFTDYPERPSNTFEALDRWEEPCLVVECGNDDYWAEKLAGVVA